MWVAVRGVIVFMFGDDLIKYALYALGGLFCFTVLEAGAASHAIFGQPWGQWWLAGQQGGIAQSRDVVAQPAAVANAPAVAVPVPVSIPAVLDTSLLQEALTWLGTRYEWGGCTKHVGVDCSCFVQSVLATVGIRAPRVTTDQIRWATPVSADQRLPFDLVFFDNTCSNCGANPTHVGMYLGDGMMIDAGSPVQIERVYTGHNARYGRPH